MFNTLTAAFVSVFIIGFFLGAMVHDKLRNIQDQDKKYNKN